MIFKYPRDTSQYFIKRIIGLPGETVNITGGKIVIVRRDGTTINLSEPYIVYQGNGMDMSVSLANDQYFVMGDNRPESSDSRTWGILPRSDMVGRAILRLLPVNTLSILPGSTSQTQ